MEKDNLIKDIKASSQKTKTFKSFLSNKYVLLSLVCGIWVTFLDSTSILVINDLDKEIHKYQKKVDYYKKEYEKNEAFYQKLKNSKDEREKYARENYFMKRKNEEIFILVIDSTGVTPKK